MKLIRNRPQEMTSAKRPDGRSSAGQDRAGGCVVAIGNFDGMHLGHAALLEQAQKLAGDELPVAVVSFEPLPAAFFRPDQAPARLSTVYQKLQWFKQQGVDITWLMRFDGRLAALSAREFVEQVLVQALDAKAVVVGEDFRFGKGRQGGTDTLGALGEEFSFNTELVAAVTLEGERISSTRIRQALAAGQFGLAKKLLGRAFRMEGRVIRGAGLGKKLGYPTANLRVRKLPSPVHGVMAAWARVQGDVWRATVCSLGTRPAVGGKDPLLEVHFFDFDRDLYGQRIDVQFVAKLRDEQDFDNIDQLIQQMNRDEAQARAVLARHEPPEQA